MSVLRPAPMPKPARLFETHLTVGDLDRSIAFYRDVVGLPLAYALAERGAAFFWIGGPGESMLGLWSLGSAPVGLSLHLAFQVSLAEALGACDALRAVGITPLSFFGPETGRRRDGAGLSLCGRRAVRRLGARERRGHAGRAEPPRILRG